MASPAHRAPAGGDTPLGVQIAPVIFLAAIFFLNFIARIIPAPLLPAIEGDLAISHSQAGSLFLIISSGYFFTLVGSGFVSARLTHRLTIVLSAVALGLALMATALSNGLGSLRLGLLLTGMASGLYLPSGIAIITALVDQRHWGKAIAVHELAPNLSFIAAPLVAEGLLWLLPWRGAFGLLGLCSLTLGCAYARFGRGGDFAGQAPALAALGTLLRLPAFWIMLALISLGISVTLGIYTMLPLYLVSGHGISRSLANSVVSFSRLACIAMAFAGGWASDRYGPKRTMGTVLVLSGMLTVIMGNVSGAMVILLVFLQPLLGACFFPAGMAALSLIGPANLRNVTVSLTIPLAFVLGAGVVPTGIGLAGEAGSFGLGISLVGGLTLIGAILTHFLRLPPQREYGLKPGSGDGTAGDTDMPRAGLVH